MEALTLIYISIIIVTIFLLSKWKHSYWKRRNVYHLEPEFFYGNTKAITRGEANVCEIVDKVYKEAKAIGEKYCGLYSLWMPLFIPVDIELVKSVLQTDFAHFTNHGGYVNEEREPLSGHLFNLENEKWRKLRAKLTPTFTSGKMKMMFQTMVECTSGLDEMLKESVTINEPIDIKELAGRFTTDIIGSVAFGLEINSMKNPDSEFRKFGKRIFEITFRFRLVFTLFRLLPKWLFEALGVRIFTNDMENFFINLVRETVDHREKNNIYRKDFMHLLIQLKNLGRVTDDAEGISKKENSTFQGLTINEMAAQSFVFFAAGFETSATTMTFALLELSQNKDIQERVREEIIKVLGKHGNKMTYEAISDMEYLDNVVSETLRKHPPVATLPRKCNKDYTIPETSLVIKAGTVVNIPVYSIHRDPEYYPDPEKFDPERFTEENKASRPACSYLPFGEGPRLCIGLRFGRLQAKVGLVEVLKNYRVTLNEKTKLPIGYESGFISSVKGGVWLNLELIN